MPDKEMQRLRRLAAAPIMDEVLSVAHYGGWHLLAPCLSSLMINCSLATGTLLRGCAPRTRL